VFDPTINTLSHRAQRFLVDGFLVGPWKNVFLAAVGDLEADLVRLMWDMKELLASFKEWVGINCLLGSCTVEHAACWRLLGADITWDVVSHPFFGIKPDVVGDKLDRLLVGGDETETALTNYMVFFPTKTDTEADGFVGGLYPSRYSLWMRFVLVNDDPSSHIWTQFIDVNQDLKVGRLYDLPLFRIKAYNGKTRRLFCKEETAVIGVNSNHADTREYMMRKYDKPLYSPTPFKESRPKKRHKPLSSP
jgi:hypothetical protein